jgi:tRNA(adenine34) deaminase
MNASHIKFMEAALVEAEKAGQQDEVPIGAVVVDGSGEILATGRNQTISMTDPSAHAEILAIRQTALKINNYRLLGTTLYVTVEPCIMCMAAAIHARVDRVVFGAPDPKWGAAGSLYHFAEDNRLNHSLEVIGGVCEDRCRELIQSFFRQKRSQKGNCPV